MTSAPWWATSAPAASCRLTKQYRHPPLFCSRAVRCQALRQWNSLRRYANKPTTEWLMTTDWVNATKWSVCQSGHAFLTCSAPKRSGRAGRTVSDCTLGEENKRLDRGKSQRCFFHARSCFHHPWMTLPINIPPKTRLDSKLTSENMTKLECKNSSVQFQWQPNLHQHQREDEETESLIHIHIWHML